MLKVSGSILEFKKDKIIERKSIYDSRSVSSLRKSCKNQNGNNDKHSIILPILSIVPARTCIPFQNMIKQNLNEIVVLKNNRKSKNTKSRRSQYHMLKKVTINTGRFRFITHVIGVGSLYL